jgi:pimeloyl-ACP methyl ester carboxylesterase
MKLEHITFAARGARRGPPLLFIHGTFCGAWVWMEHFMPYLADRGWECHALSLRGHGRSDGRDLIDTFGIEDFLEDIKIIADRLPEPPIIIGHSQGGMLAQLFACRQKVAGMALLGSVGPGGLSGSMAHMAVKYPAILNQIILVQVFGSQFINPDVMRFGIFSPDFPREQAFNYSKRLQRDSQRMVHELMMPQWLNLLDRPEIPVMVISGFGDAFIPAADVLATAMLWRTEPLFLNIPHASMLDHTWEVVASELNDWLDVSYADMPISQPINKNTN